MEAAHGHGELSSLQPQACLAILTNSPGTQKAPLKEAPWLPGGQPHKPRNECQVFLEAFQLSATPSTHFLWTCVQDCTRTRMYGVCLGPTLTASALRSRASRTTTWEELGHAPSPRGQTRTHVIGFHVCEVSIMGKAIDRKWIRLRGEAECLPNGPWVLFGAKNQLWSRMAATAALPCECAERHELYTSCG